MKSEFLYKLSQSVQGMLDGAMVVVALSGGADSVSLLCGLKKLGYDVVALHVNHSLRGVAADADEMYSKKLCSSLGVPFFSEKIDVEGFAEEEKLSFEDAARRARYDFFARAVSWLSAGRLREEPNLSATERPIYVLTAHHAGDNAETFVMNALRGSSLLGLCGIPRESSRWVECSDSLPKYIERSDLPTGTPFSEGMSADTSSGSDDPSSACVRRSSLEHGDEFPSQSMVLLSQSVEVHLLRPMLAITKAEILFFLERERIAWCEDATNQSRDYLRNRVRAFLDAEDTHKIADCIDLLCVDRDYFRDRVSELARALCSEKRTADGGRVLLLRTQERLHRAELSRLIRHLLIELLGNAVDIGKRDIEAIMTLHRIGSKITVGSGERKIAVYRGYGGLEFSRLENISKTERIEQTESIESVNGNDDNDGEQKIVKERNGELPDTLYDTRENPRNRVVVKTLRWQEYQSFQASSTRVAIDRRKVVGKLRVRNRVAGDVLRPFGMRGHKKVKKLMIDKKVDARTRDAVPIVCDDEKIIWVAGLALSEEVKIERETDILVLEYVEW